MKITEQEPLRKLTDEEINEMVYLFRVARAKNSTKDEEARCRWLLRCFDKFYKGQK